MRSPVGVDTRGVVSILMIFEEPTHICVIRSQIQRPKAGREN